MRHTDTQHTSLNQDGFYFPIGNGIDETEMTRQNIYTNPESLNAKNSFIIRRKFNLTWWLICFTVKGFYPTNIFIFASKSMQFQYIYVFSDKRKGRMWVEDRISKSKNNRAAVMFCHTEIHIPLLCPVNFHE